MAALHDDIKEYAEYDKYEAMHSEFWGALLEVAEHELAEARRRDEIDRAHLKGGAAAAEAAAAAAADKGLHPDVEADVEGMLMGELRVGLTVVEVGGWAVSLLFTDGCWVLA